MIAVQLLLYSLEEWCEKMSDETMNWILFIIMGVVLLTPTVLLTVYYFTRVRKKRPSYYDRKTSAILRHYGTIRRFKVINNLQLNDSKGVVIIPHLLIGYFGILLVSTLDRRGSYFGDAKSDRWVYDDSKFKESIPNPYRENQLAILTMRNLLSKNKIYSVPIEQLIIYDSYAKKSSCFVGSDVPVLRLNKLKTYLQKAKFDKDNGLDIERLYNLFLQEGTLIEGSGPKKARTT